MDTKRTKQGWAVWRGDGGSWNATRSRELSDAEMNYGLAKTVSADDEQKLKSRLMAQEALEWAYERQRLRGAAPT